MECNNYNINIKKISQQAINHSVALPPYHIHNIIIPMNEWLSMRDRQLCTNNIILLHYNKQSGEKSACAVWYTYNIIIVTVDYNNSTMP